MKKFNFNKNLLYLLSGQFISQLGDRFYALALAVWVLKNTGSPAKMGVVLFCSTIPAVLLGLVSGGFIDKYDRRKILVGADVFRALIIVFVSVAFCIGSLNFMMIIITEILLSLNSAFFNPTVMAVIPQIVEKDNLARANSKSQLLSGVALVIGPVLGGISATYFGLGFIFIFNAISFLTSALFESMLRIPRVKDKTTSNDGIGRNIIDGYKYIFAKRRIMVIIGIVAIIHFFVGCIQVIMPVLADMLEGESAKNLGFIEMFFGIGVVASSALLAVFNINGKEEKTVFVGIFSIGVVLLGFGAVKSMGIEVVTPFSLVFMLMSASIIIVSTAYQIILQKNVENDMAGRVFGVIASVGNFSLPIASLVFGILLDYFPIQNLLFFSGSSIILTEIVLFVLYKSVNNDSQTQQA